MVVCSKFLVAWTENKKVLVDRGSGRPGLG